MKLRNKKTGEIRTAYVQVILENNHPEKPLEFHTQPSIAELNEDWEDYEEPKEYWYINEFGTPTAAGGFNRENIYDKSRKHFGNYFKTKEEAEKAVEKLKAWKRLKDKGFRFNGWFGGSKCIPYQINEWIGGDIIKDLNLLFGGDDE